MLTSIPFKGILNSESCEVFMVLVESSSFTKYVNDYFEDGEYRNFQNYLILYPEVGVLIPGTGGLRKIRWGASNKGKRGGFRIIYYWHVAREQIYLLMLYRKNEMSDLSVSEKKILSQMVERWSS